MPITAVQSNDAASDGPTPAHDTSSEIPAWLAARRERKPSDAEPAAKPALPDLEISPDPPVTRVKKPVSKFPNFAAEPKSVPVPKKETFIQNGLVLRPNWLVHWVSKQTTLGFLFSLGMHSLILTALAFIVMSRANSHDGLSLWGVDGGGEDSVSEVLIDTVLPDDAGESAPLALNSVTNTLDALGSGTDVAESMRVGLGGKGNGEDDSGTGNSMGVGSLKIPGHAQTKGSFSAWAEPRDPVPGQQYFIVIQIQLPKNVKKYRGSDLSGSVIGTDRYRQEIKLNDKIPVVDGAVQIKIPVPGAARLVRDTIKVESKLLREKQQFEIEF